MIDENDCVDPMDIIEEDITDLNSIRQKQLDCEHKFKITSAYCEQCKVFCNADDYEITLVKKKNKKIIEIKL